MKTYTLTEAALRLGRHKSRLSRAADRFGLGRHDGRERLLSAAELRILRAHFAAAKPGNPTPRDELGRYLGYKI